MNRVKSYNIKRDFIHILNPDADYFGKDAIEFADKARGIIRNGFSWTAFDEFDTFIKEGIDKSCTKFPYCMYDTYGVLYNNITRKTWRFNRYINDRVEMYNAIDNLIDEYRRKTKLFYMFNISKIINTSEIRKLANKPMLHVRAGSLIIDTIDKSKLEEENDAYLSAMCYLEPSGDYTLNYVPGCDHINLYELYTDGKVKLSGWDKEIKIPDARYYQITDYTCTILQCSFYKHEHGYTKLDKRETIMFI